MRWNRLAAEQGSASAQNSLASMYVTGQGVIQNMVYAHMWVHIAATNGNELGGKFRDVIVKTMTSAQLEKAQNLASKCVAMNYKEC